MSGLFSNEYPYTDFHELNLSWVLEQIKKLIEHMNDIDKWKDEYQDTVNDLQKFYNDLIAGNYPPAFIDHLKHWIEINGVELIGTMIKGVFFGLENGYFVAYIPDSWNEIDFGTSGLDDFPAGVDFGHLTLSY